MDEKLQEEFENSPEKRIVFEKEERVINKKGKIKSTNVIIRAVNYLESIYDIRLNTDTKQVEIKRKTQKGKKHKEYELIDDTTYRYLKIELEMNGISLSDEKFRNIIYSGYFFNSYAPFKDYILHLPQWDRELDYLARWCEQVNLVDEEKHRKYFIEGFKKWFVALVVSLVVDTPHRYYINQTCLIFTGKQGKFKSTFLDNLLPNEWRLKYYMEGIYDFHKEESQKYLGQKVIINLEELAAFTRGDIEAIKSRITQVIASLRLKWGKEDTFFKRRASFAGSTNDKEFLMDVSGTRRFFVIPIEKIFIDESLNVDNIYAQALALYKDGFKYWFDDDDIKQIEHMNADFKVSSLEEELILDYYRKPEKEDYELNRVRYVTSSEVANRLCLKFQRLNVNNSVKRNIGRAFNANDFKQTSIKVNGKSSKRWHVIEIDEPRVEVPNKQGENDELF